MPLLMQRIQHTTRWREKATTLLITAAVPGPTLEAGSDVHDCPLQQPLKVLQNWHSSEDHAGESHSMTLCHLGVGSSQQAPELGQTMPSDPCTGRFFYHSGRAGSCLLPSYCLDITPMSQTTTRTWRCSSTPSSCSILAFGMFFFALLYFYAICS